MQKNLLRLQAQQKLIQELSLGIPLTHLIYADESVQAYECDGLTAYRQKPLCVVIPDTYEQVQFVLTTCYKLDIPVVARGAGTGLSGGALPHPLGVVLSLAKFNNILSIDPKKQIAVVQCGVRNLAISEAAAPYQLFYAPDPSSQIACTIGGNVAENSGGVHCLKYGLTLHNILHLKGFLADGSSVEFGSLAPEVMGLDLMPLVIGSEGMLAVITEVTVKLKPIPAVAKCILASFSTTEDAGQAVAAIIARGIIPAGMEMMDKPMIHAVEDFVHAGYDLDAQAIILCESDGSAEEVNAEIDKMIEVFQDSNAVALRISGSEEERKKFWSGRKNAFPASGRISPDYMCMDSTILRQSLAEMLRLIKEMENKYQLRCANVFHAGDGNLHPLILFDASDADQLHRAELFGAEILETSVALGGTVSGEHGIGIEKLNSMCVQFTTEECKQMLSLKKAFDEKGILNPGKTIPTLARCAEYGKMVIRGGQLPFSNLERF
ncbi:MAG: FAD-linked oxidase C-terminal domain-containing protein [Gammaproteobacteria bacterium]|nr:FAD-linked oxidase C-terminal domain-containing protein [Gammaproteobacteria bacterium]